MAISFGTPSSIIQFSGETGPKSAGVTLTQAGKIVLVGGGESFASLTTVSITGFTNVVPVDIPYSNNNGARLFMAVSTTDISAGSYSPAAQFSQAVFGQMRAIPCYGAANFNGTNDPVKTATGSSTTPATGTNGNSISKPNSAVFSGFADSGNAWTGATSPPNYNGSNASVVNILADLGASFLPCVFAYKLITGSTTEQACDVGTTPTSPWGAGRLILVEATAASGGGLTLLGVG